ncbi:beta strand repeat-containing protein [Methanobacterium spitsbergense]|uniref:Ig-like domain-containing protein n=1 Tax=Methanobacterium spitsbergense TaxID=2874285 RepID=A0A8T5UYL8_9EURY|nr:Ig-like domain-containing protein [Methanobacterium spitsbergense]MBZ2164515.1 Ig-like domain-containing protein [Methanobacterium spitsbergense]
MGNVSAASGDTIYVNGNSTLGNDDWNGESATYQSGIIGPKYSIKNATGTVNTNGQIYIANEQYKGINNTQITIDKNMTINGESQTDTIINGTGTNGIFHINSGIYVTINNLTLTNATTTYYGGAIYNVGTLTINNSTFTSNTADVGGAIYNNGRTLNVTDSTFTNNYANYYGGAIYNAGTLNVNNNTFTSNTASHSGGAIYNENTVTVNDSTFTSNTATQGGAIYNYYGTVTVNNSTFTSNSATYSGGAIYNEDNLTITGSNFTSNIATFYGGSIFNGENGKLTVTESKFTGNTATSYDGGAIYSYEGGNLTVNGSTFTNNNASGGGGAIQNYGGTCNINNSIFNGNIAAIWGGSISNSDGSIPHAGILTINGSTFTGSSSSYNYGAIYNSGTICTITCNNITGNNGIAIYTINANTQIHFNRILNNTGSYDIWGISGVNATNNWWGTNFQGNNPVTAGRVNNNVNANTWLILSLKASTTSILNGGNSTVIVDLQHDNNGTVYNPANGHVPDGIVVNLSSDALGTVNPLTGTMINGMASTIFTAGLNPGISTITSTVDAATVTTDVTINENVPPVVTSTSPVNNSVNVDLNKVIQIVFDKNIKFGVNPWIELYETGTGNIKTFSTNIVDNVLSITPSSLLALGTEYSVILHSNSITNLAGIGLAAPYTTRFTTEAAPVVTSTNPLYNAFNVALNKVIQITFDKAIQLGTNPWIELKTSNSGTIVPYTTNIIGNVLSITPNSLLNAGTKYTVILHSNSITDMQGNGLNTPYTTIFTTTLPPVVTSTSPMNNEVNVAVNKVIQINFSKAIQLGTNSWIELKNQYGQIKPYTTSINGNTLNITANAAFARGTTYTVILHSNSVTSTGGAGLTTPYTTKFTTTTT